MTTSFTTYYAISLVLFYAGMFAFFSNSCKKYLHSGANLTTLIQSVLLFVGVPYVVASLFLFGYKYEVFNVATTHGSRIIVAYTIIKTVVSLVYFHQKTATPKK